MSHSTAPTFCVYRATNRVNGKAYVGITSKGASVRWREHVYNARTERVCPIHLAILKYGTDAFDVEVIETCLGYDMLRVREVYWIAKLRTRAPRGYNLTAGGEGMFGYRTSDETKRKMSATKTGKKKSPEMRAKMREIALNRPPEHLAKISAALTGRKIPRDVVEKVRKSNIGRTASPESIEKRMAKIRGMKHTPESRANMSRAQIGRTFSPESRLKIRDSLRSLTPEHAAIIKFDGLGLRQKDYAILFGVSPQMVNGIVKGRSYEEVTLDDLPRNLDRSGLGWAG